MTDRLNREKTRSSAQKDRNSRLAAALKANIARRKAQARGRADGDADGDHVVEAGPETSAQEQDKEK